MRRGRIQSGRIRSLGLASIAAAIALLALAAPAAAGIITPESGGSPNAEDISTLYEITLYIAIVIFLLVEGVLLWSLFRYRHRRGGAEPAQIRGNAPLEIGWTIGASLILVVLTVITFIYLGDIETPAPSGPDGLQAAEGVQVASINQPEPPGGESLEIEVNGQQYLWRYEYPTPELPEGELPVEQNIFSYHRMVVPVDTTVTLQITSSDVAHSWWIPELGGKADALPGHTNETWFRISEPGLYGGACAELCGNNHADMRAEVLALPVEEYEAWIEQQAGDIQESQELLAVQRQIREREEE